MHELRIVNPARPSRAKDPNVVVHRATIPRQKGEAPIQLIVQVREGSEEMVIDVSAASAGPDDEATSILQRSEFLPTRPSRAALSEPAPTTIAATAVAATAVSEVALPAAALVLAPGGRVGKYELREKLGMGTFGLVFTARDADLDRDIALKVLNPQHVTNHDVLQRFLQEARASARIQHPGIVTVFDYGRIAHDTGETAFITMELLQGESLTSRLARSGRLAPSAACEIARQVASALDAAHRADVLHRDLKPDNIFLVADPAVANGERVKVLDFGLAKLGRHGHTMMNTVFGTPRYMSPEQCRSAAAIDHRSDIYALGCVLFELITGRTPFDGDLRQLMERHQRATPPRAASFVPEISPALDELIDSMLAKDPAARPQTMGALQPALQAVGALPVGIHETIMPLPAHLMMFPPMHPRLAVSPAGSGPRVFDASDLAGRQRPPTVRPPTGGRNPALMLPPEDEGRRQKKRNVAIATAVAFVVAALLAAIATRAPAIAGTPMQPAPAPTSSS